MRSRIHAIVVPSEASDFADELGRLFAELSQPSGLAGLAGECAPPLDVFETDESVEIVVDLPGVAESAVRIVAKGQAVLIAGEKTPRRARGDSSFHLVERGYGRFARAVRLNSPCDTAHGRAVFHEGELRISIPKRPERRNHAITIPIAAGRPDA